MKPPRTVLHLDLDAFFCAVEELRNPNLIGTAFAVGGSPEGRGVVASCSYRARLHGIHSAMPMAKALIRCPDLIVVSGHYAAYEEASRAVMKCLLSLTPLVEQISIDEAFLDVSHQNRAGRAVAFDLQQIVKDSLGLPCSIGMASNKLVAKIATEVGKASVTTGDYPRAIHEVPPGSEASFLAPLPVRMLWGVGPKTAERFRALGITRIGDIASRSETELTDLFGEYGRDLSRRSRGIDDRPISTEHDTKSVSHEVTFARDVDDEDTLRHAILDLADKVGRRLRRADLAGTTVKLKLRWSDFSTITRQSSLSQATNSDDLIGKTAISLFEKSWRRHRPVRLIGVGVTGLSEPEQLTLWDEIPLKNRKLQDTLDTLRDRFGDGSIRRGGSIARHNR